MSNTPLALVHPAQAAPENGANIAAPPIYVTQPALPPLHEFIPYLEAIWANKILTNGGPFHQQLENALCDYLGVKHLALFSNGTLGLVTALQALRITGEVITTPYSFVATAHSLLWNGIKPVFADVHPDTLNLDPARIEAAITPQTTAILPVHCYGHPADVEAIQKIADNYNLKVIYDAAHAFGVQDTGGSVLRHGDAEASRDFCFIVNLLTATVQRSHVLNQIDNVAIGERTTFNDLYAQLHRNLPPRSHTCRAPSRTPRFSRGRCAPQPGRHRQGAAPTGLRAHAAQWRRAGADYAVVHRTEIGHANALAAPKESLALKCPALCRQRTKATSAWSTASPCDHRVKTSGRSRSDLLSSP